MNELENAFMATLTAPVIDRASYEIGFVSLLDSPCFILECEKYIEQLYSSGAISVDGYSRLAFLCWLGGEKWLNTAIQLWEKDIALERIGWWQALRYAIALFPVGGIERSIEVIYDIYGRFSEARNGFISLAMRLGKDKLFQALELGMRDYKLSRLTPYWHFHLIVILLASDAIDEAVSHFKALNSQDGYAIIEDGLEPWTSAPWTEVIEFYKKAGRFIKIPPSALLKNEIRLATMGDCDSAIAGINQAYAQDTSITDGFSRLAWEYHMPRHLFDEALELIEADRKTGRLSNDGCLNLAVLHALRGDLQLAVGTVSAAYEKDETLKGGYCRVAWEFYIPKGMISPALELMRLDIDSGRAFPEWIDRFDALCEMLEHPGKFNP